MTDFPISDEGLIQAKRVYARDAVIGPDTAMQNAIQAFLEAEGFETYSTENAIVEGTLSHRTVLRSKWRPDDRS